MNTEVIKQVSKKITNNLAKNSPVILISLSVAGLVTTVVLAVKATPKAEQVIFDLESSSEYTEKLTKMEIVKETWKLYVPTVGMGLFTIFCIISANSINLKRNAALAGVYSLTEATLKEYQSKVIDTIGLTKEKKIKDEIAQDKIINNPMVDKEVIITNKGETLCYDAISGRYFKSDIEKIRKAENELNHDMLTDMFISLNDVYYALGLDNISMGDEIGWKIDDTMIAFEFSSQLTKEGLPCLVIDYAVKPRYDYMD